MVPPAEYVHQPLHQEVVAIGGTFLLVKELRLLFKGRELLYVVGHAVFDNTCCGTGGCAYALVPGFVREWKSETKSGLAVSRVEPIHHRFTQDQVRQMIEKREVVQGISFLPGPA